LFDVYIGQPLLRGIAICIVFFFSSRRRHTRFSRDWSSDVCSSDLPRPSSRLRSQPQAPPRVAWHWKMRLSETCSCANTAEALRKIGRASCRERVKIRVDVESATQKRHAGTKVQRK